MPPQVPPEELPTKMVGPSTRMSAPDDPRVGTMLGKYRITRVLGRGGMGVVYAAEDTVLGREVAIKLLLDDRSGEPEALERFLLEARAAARLNHPNVVAVHDVAETGGLYYIVMEFIDGMSAQQMLRGKQTVSWKEAVRIVVECCKALQAAHKAGFIHRDIKPANIMVARDGTVKLADFGLAKATERTGASLTSTGAILCSPEFMSPEQCTAKPLDGRTDIYSLGATLYALLTGTAPFARPGSTTPQLMYAHCYEPVPDVRAVKAEVPAPVAELITKAMAKKAADRYATAADMRVAAEALLGGSAGASTGRRRGGKLKWIAALLILGGAGAAAWVYREELAEFDWNRPAFRRKPAEPNGDPPSDGAGAKDADTKLAKADGGGTGSSSGSISDGGGRNIGSVVKDDGASKDGGVAPKDGTVVKDGGASTKDGAATPKDASAHPKDGTVTPKDGTVSPKDGSARPKDGTITPKDGTVTPKDGRVSPKDGPLVAKDGVPIGKIDPVPPKDGSLKKPPDDPRRLKYNEHMRRGRELMAARSFESAAVEFDQAERLIPGDAEALAAAKAARKEIEDARIATVELATRRAEYNRRLKAGKDAYAQRRFDSAVEEFTAALRAVPGDADALGLLKQATKARDEERVSLEEQRKRKSEYDRLHASGRKALAERRYDEAAREFALAVRQLLPGDPNRELLTAEAEKLRREALDRLEFARLMEEGRKADLQSRHGEAVKAYEAALKLFPDDTEARRLLGAARDLATRNAREHTASIGMKFVLVPAGEFLMGSDEHPDEKPVHKVRISRDFFMGVHPVTVAEFRKFVEDSGYKTDAETDRVKGGWSFNPAGGVDEYNTSCNWKTPGFIQAEDHPVVQVSWMDAVEFCKWLSQKDKKTYRMPTEAEWEYACRAGTTTRWYTGDQPAGLEGAANIADASLAGRMREGLKRRQRCATWNDRYPFTSPVGAFRANALGLYDMHGNVLQWCQDRFDEKFNAYRDGPPSDPTGAPVSNILPATQLRSLHRILRGGSWKDGIDAARSAYRYWFTAGSRYDNFGFRVVMEKD